MTVPDDERLGPAFDSNILSRPTQRKFVGCWMDRAGLDTLILLETAAEQVGVQPELGKGRGAGTDDVPPIQVVAPRADARRVAPGASAAEGVARAANHMGHSASPVSYR